MKRSNVSYLGAHVGWKVRKAYDAEAKRRGKKRSWRDYHSVSLSK